MSKSYKKNYAWNSSEAWRMFSLDNEKKNEIKDLDKREFLLKQKILAKLSKRASLIKMRFLKWDINSSNAKAELNLILSEAETSGVVININDTIAETNKHIDWIIEDNDEKSL